MLRDLNMPSEAVFYTAVALTFQAHEGRRHKIPVISEIVRSLRKTLGENRFQPAAREAKERLEALRLRLERDDIDFSKGIAVLDERSPPVSGSASAATEN
jgi:hypothetical protein